MSRTALWPVIGLTAALLAAVAWSYGHLAEQRRAADLARLDSLEVDRMAAQIRAVRDRPTMADEDERLAEETIGLIEAAARAAAVAPGRLVRITPEPPQRLGDSVYKEKPTAVLLKGVSLRQVVGLVHTLIGGDRGLSAKSIRLSAPRHDDEGELWTAEIVVTYLIYDPPSAP